MIPGASRMDAALPSVRASLLDAAIPSLAALDAVTPDRCIVSTPDCELDLPGPEVRALAEAIADDLLLAADALPDERLFARAAPHDESVARHLSFAGVYRSYRPLRDRPRSEYLIDGLVAVMLGRRNRVAEYYYERHGLRTGRAVDVMYTAFVPTMAMHGTGYSCQGRVLVTYCDTPLATYLDDPRRCAAFASAPPTGLDGRLVRCLAGLEDVLGVSVDVEFVITRDEQIFVTQVRPLSPVHVDHWSRLADETWLRATKTGPPSNTVNSVGAREGVLVDLRCRPPSPDDGEPGRVLVISHRDGDAATSTLALLEHALRSGWRDLAVVVDHGSRRHDDHLQYLMAEDPAVAWVGHTTNLSDRLPDGPVLVRGDGFTVEIPGVS
jgi:hypothetical protein